VLSIRNIAVTAIAACFFIALSSCESTQEQENLQRNATEHPSESIKLATARNATEIGFTNNIKPIFFFKNQMPTGVTVSHTSRIFVCYPRWGDTVNFTVAELRNGQEIPYPDEQINQADLTRPADTFVSVQSVVVDPVNRLWALDTGSINFQPVIPNGPKLVQIDLDTNRIVQVIRFPSTVVLPTTYLNDIRFDLTRGRAGYAYITDSASMGPNGIIVVDLATGESWRRLSGHASTTAQPNFVPYVEGAPLMQREPNHDPRAMTMGSDGIAISADGRELYYCPLSGRYLYAVSTEALINRNLDDAQVASTVRDLGERPFASDGLESDSAGRIYLTDYEHNAIHARELDGKYRMIAQDPHLIWPDTLCVSNDGFLYVTANQLDRMPRFNNGQDLRQRPCALFRMRLDARPVDLK